MASIPPRHQSPRIGVLDSYLKRLEVYFAQSAFADLTWTEYLLPGITTHTCRYILLIENL